MILYGAGYRQAVVGFVADVGIGSVEALDVGMDSGGVALFKGFSDTTSISLGRGLRVLQLCGAFSAGR